MKRTSSIERSPNKRLRDRREPHINSRGKDGDFNKNFIRMRAEAGTPAYAYEVDFQSPIDGGKWHTPHTIDIALSFDNTDKPGALAGNGPEARKLAAQMSETFIAFSRTGNPNNPALPAWKPYTLPNRETMIFDVASHMENDPRGRERELFEKVPFIQQGT